MSPFDAPRLAWRAAATSGPVRTWQSRVPEQFSLGGRVDQDRWLFSSSYETATAAFTPDQQSRDGGSLFQGDAHSIFQYSQTETYRLGQRLASNARFPGDKVLMFEPIVRDQRRAALYFTHPAARTTNLFVDGSVREVANREINNGHYWDGLSRFTAAIVTYRTPRTSTGEPTWPSDGTDTSQRGKQRWTAGGLQGRDTGGRPPFTITPTSTIQLD